MENSASELEGIKSYMAKVVEQRPYIGTLLNAFRPILIEKIHLLQLLQGQKKTFPLDAMKFQGGVALGQQFQLFYPDDPWKEIAGSVARAISLGFPALQEDMQLLEEQVATGVVDCYDFFQDSSVDDDNLRLMTSAVQCSVSTAALGLFLRVVEGVILRKRAVDMKETLASLSWDKGYCPVCASMPMLAIIREQGQQWLQCSRCSHEWKFARVTCPSCDHKSPEDTTYLYVEGNSDEKVFVCEECRSYLISVNQAGTLQPQSPEVLAISLTHLDLILQGKGYSQMAVCDWNTP